MAPSPTSDASPIPEAPPASDPSPISTVSPSSTVSPWSREGSLDVGAAQASLGPASSSAADSTEAFSWSTQPPRRDPISVPRWAILAAAVVAVVAIAAVLIVQVLRPDGAPITDLGARLIPIPAGRTACPTDGQHYTAAQLADSTVLPATIASGLVGAGLVDTATRCWFDSSGARFAVTLLRFNSAVDAGDAGGAITFAGIAAQQRVLPVPGVADGGSETMHMAGGDVPVVFGWKEQILFLVIALPESTANDSTLDQIGAQQYARL